MDFALAELGFTDLRLVGREGRARRHPHLGAAPRVRREVQATKAGARGKAASAPRPRPPGAAGAPPELRIDDLEIERAEFSVLTDGEPVSVALRLEDERRLARARRAVPARLRARGRQGLGQR